MSKKFETGSEESINLIMESLKMVGIDCRRTKPGEKGGVSFTKMKTEI